MTDKKIFLVLTEFEFEHNGKYAIELTPEELELLKMIMREDANFDLCPDCEGIRKALLKKLEAFK